MCVYVTYAYYTIVTYAYHTVATYVYHTCAGIQCPFPCTSNICSWAHRRDATAPPPCATMTCTPAPGSTGRPLAEVWRGNRLNRRAAISRSEERPSAGAESSHRLNRRAAIGQSGERPLAEAERERKRAAPQAVCCGTALCVNGEDARPRCLRGTGGARSAYRMGSMANV